MCFLLDSVPLSQLLHVGAVSPECVKACLPPGDMCGDGDTDAVDTLPLFCAARTQCEPSLTSSPPSSLLSCGLFPLPLSLLPQKGARPVGAWLRQLGVGVPSLCC